MVWYPVPSDTYNVYRSARFDLPICTSVPTYCRYRYRTRTERYAQCEKGGDVTSICLPVRGDAPSPRAGEKAVAGGDRAQANRGQRPVGGNGRRARTVRERVFMGYSGPLPEMVKGVVFRASYALVGPTNFTQTWSIAYEFVSTL
ncbi:hypothetical protein GW17_00016985 [Ensete ventricosum]|nr:hypothetical protein GW17_00016985 [Ensete ventricosum]